VVIQPQLLGVDTSHDLGGINAKRETVYVSLSVSPAFDLETAGVRESAAGWRDFERHRR
jgi:hypothetical protein